MKDARTLAEALRKVDHWHSLGIDAQAAALLNLLSSPDQQLAPIPYTEREPEAKDCNNKGQCWRFNPGNPGLSSPFLVHDSWVFSCHKIGTHWLPHDVPSLPTNFKADPVPYPAIFRRLPTRVEP